MNSLAFKDIYILYFAKLKRFAKEYVLTEEDAENIVHDVFTHLLENWALLSAYQNLFSYLFLVTKNNCMDFLRHRTVVRKAENEMATEYRLAMQANYLSLEAFNQQPPFQEDLEETIQKALGSLPEKCRIIFIKNKLEGKKQKEIAAELNISVHTVESQMAIAYKKLRYELKNLLSVLK